MKDGTDDGGVAKVEKTADLIEERAAFEQRPRQQQSEGMGKEGSGIHAVSFTRDTVKWRLETSKEVSLIHCWASPYSLGFEDEDLGSSLGWWAATVATYCPSRRGNYTNSYLRNLANDETPNSVHCLLFFSILSSCPL